MRRPERETWPALNRFASGSCWKTLEKPGVEVPKNVDVDDVSTESYSAVAVTRQAEPRLDERVAEGQRPADRAPREVREDVKRVEELDARVDQSLSRKYGSKKRRLTSWRSAETCACSASDWPLPKRFACCTCAVAMKFSIELKPAPTWNVPVGFSATSTLMLSLSGRRPLLGRDVDALEVAERRDALACGSRGSSR